MLCKNLHSEIGTHSPALWKNLILREGWTEPKNVQADPTTLYKSFFVSHHRICQRVEALKMGVTKLLTFDDDIGYLDFVETEIHVWDDQSVLTFSQDDDCVVRLYQVSTQTSLDDKCLRDIMQVRLAPFPTSECRLRKMAISDGYVLFAFGLDNQSSDILASIMKDELLSNSTEGTIECGDCLKKHELSLMVKDLYDRTLDHNDLRFLSDLLGGQFLEGQSFENDLQFCVYDLIEVGPGIFCVLVGLYRDDWDDYRGDVLLSISVLNGRGTILDYIGIPPSSENVQSLSSNMEWKDRSDPVGIICHPASGDVEHVVANMDRSGVFHGGKPFTIQNWSGRIIPGSLPINSSQPWRTPSSLVGYSRAGGGLDVYDMEDGLLPEILILKTEFNTVLSMNHLGNDYVMMLCQRDAIRVPPGEDKDGQNYECCLYFIVIHIPSMEEIYVSRITNIGNEDMMVAIGKVSTIVVAVQWKGYCLSSPHVLPLKALEEHASNTANASAKTANANPNTAPASQMANGMQNMANMSPEQ